MSKGSKTRKQQWVLANDYIQILQRLGFIFTLNECNDRVEVNGEPITDVMESVIFSLLRDHGFPHVYVARDAYIACAYRHSYHPIRKYLNSLSYDGGKYISDLAGYFDNPDGMFENWLRRWLIGAVRRALQGGAQNRMLVLDGPQNIGKSKFVEWLCPGPLRNRHFISGPIFPDNKDHKLALMERWIWEVAELGSTTRKADREALKYFITLERVTERMPYARYAIQKPALTSFIGTVNNEAGLLSDPTGNRRYMFCKLNGIDWEGYTANVNVDNVWAEAQMLYYEGVETADLTPDEEQKAQELNESYQVENPLEGILFEYFDVDPKETWWTPSSEIISTLEDPPVPLPASSTPYKKPISYNGTTSMTSRQLSTVMASLGCERSKKRHNGSKNSSWGYCGVRRKVP